MVRLYHSCSIQLTDYTRIKSFYCVHHAKTKGNDILVNWHDEYIEGDEESI